MKDNHLTYDLRSTNECNTINHNHLHNYESRIHSPTNNFKSNIAKIDEELLHLKQKIKTVRNTPTHSLSKISFQYASTTNKTEDSFHFAMAKLVNELKEKENIIENMIGDIKLMENRMMSYQNANEDLTRQLDNEIQSRLQMESQLKTLIQRVNELEEENMRLKEDNIRMYTLIEEMKQEYYPIEKERRKYNAVGDYNDKWIDLNDGDDYDRKEVRFNSSNVFAKRINKQSRYSEENDSYPTLLNATENVIYNKPRRIIKNNNNYYDLTNKSYDAKNPVRKNFNSNTFDFDGDIRPLETDINNDSNIKDLYNKYNLPESDEDNLLCKSCQCYPKREQGKADNSMFSYAKSRKDDSYTSPMEIKETDMMTDDYFTGQSYEGQSVPKQYNCNKNIDNEREFANSKPKQRALKENNINSQLQQQKGTNCLGLSKNNHREKPWIAFKPEKDNSHFEPNNESKEDANIQEEVPKQAMIKANTTRHPVNTKSRSYDFRNNNPKNRPLTEEDEFSNNNNKHYQQQQPFKKYNAYIKVDDGFSSQPQPLKKNMEIKDKLNNIKEQINNIQQQSKSNNNNASNLHEISIDEINSNHNKEINTTTNYRYAPVDTNLDTLPAEDNKTPPHSLNITSSKEKIITLLDKVNQLTETVSQNKEEVKTKQYYIDSIEQENKLLKDKLQEQNNKLASPTLSPKSNLTQQQQVNQITYTSLPSFFNQSMIKEKIIVKSKNNLNMSTGASGGNVFSKLKLNTSLDDSFSKNKVQLSDNILFKPYDKKRLLCFDISNYKFNLIDFIDYSNYDNNYGKGGIIYLNHDNGLYIITGENSDCLYNYTHSTKSMSKLSNLNNNHSMGGFVQYTKTATGEQCLICISGWYNKKVEEYSTKKNEWGSLPEVLVERGESAYLVCNNQRVYAFFGYNCPQKKYLNSIEYCPLNTSTEEDFKWKMIKYQYQSEAFSLYIKSHSLVSINQSHFVILGGFDGKDNQPIDSFIQMTIEDNNESESGKGKEQVTFSKVNRKLFGIDKNHLYNFNCDFTMLCNSKGMSYQVCYDEVDRVHVINLSSMSHDIFYFD